MDVGGGREGGDGRGYGDVGVWRGVEGMGVGGYVCEYEMCGYGGIWV